MKVPTLILVFALAGCSSFRTTGIVGAGAGAGAAVGSLAGPVGAIGGAVVGGAISSSVVESDNAQARVIVLEDRLTHAVPTPPAGPLERVAGIPWWVWLVALWVYLRRAHLADVLTGKNPRPDAILRALGLRTHKTPIPARI